MRTCPYCGKEYPDDVLYCVIDRNRLEPFDPALDTQLVERGDRCEGVRLVAICEALSKANEQCSEYGFGIDRAVMVWFHGHEVCLVTGTVGAVGPPSEAFVSRGEKKIVYALAESQDQITWMAHETDAFKPVRDDGTFPVFWVVEPSLRRLARIS